MKESLRLTTGHNALDLTRQVDSGLNAKTESLSHLGDVVDTCAYAQSHEIDVAGRTHCAVEVKRAVTAIRILEASEDPSVDVQRRDTRNPVGFRRDSAAFETCQSRDRLKCRTRSVH